MQILGPEKIVKCVEEKKKKNVFLGSFVQVESLTSATPERLQDGFHLKIYLKTVFQHYFHKRAESNQQGGKMFISILFSSQRLVRSSKQCFLNSVV